MFSAPSSGADSKDDHRHEYEGDSYTDRLDPRDVRRHVS